MVVNITEFGPNTNRDNGHSDRNTADRDAAQTTGDEVVIRQITNFQRFFDAAELAELATLPDSEAAEIISAKLNQECAIMMLSTIPYFQKKEVLDAFVRWADLLFDQVTFIVADLPRQHNYKVFLNIGDANILREKVELEATNYKQCVIKAIRRVTKQSNIEDKTKFTVLTFQNFENEPRYLAVLDILQRHAMPGTKALFYQGVTTQVRSTTAVYENVETKLAQMEQAGLSPYELKSNEMYFVHELSKYVVEELAALIFLLETGYGTVEFDPTKPFAMLDSIYRGDHPQIIAELQDLGFKMLPRCHIYAEYPPIPKHRREE